jgi:hypothetical protein
MKTLQQIQSYQSAAFDGRDITRLAKFIPENEMHLCGLELKPEAIGKHVHKELTRENVLSELERDLSFAFYKALGKRGLSAGLMYEVISMWNWILEEGLEDFDEENYAQYGLPLFKATAVKYGFDNPIGDDEGDEYKYSAEADYE